MASTVAPFPSRTAQGETSTPVTPALAGSLSQMPLPDLLQTASNNLRTGRIDLEGGEHDDAHSVGRIWMREGRVVDASVQDGLTGRDALYHLLTWTHGRFALNTVTVDAPDRIQDSTSFLLLDAMRQIDEDRRGETPGHAGLPEEPPEPSREQQAVHLSLLLLNVSSTWVGGHLLPDLIVQRLEEVRRVHLPYHPLLSRFVFDEASALISMAPNTPDIAEHQVHELVNAVGAWLRGFYQRIAMSLPGKFSLKRLAALTSAHAEPLLELGFYDALGTHPTSDLIA